jgi:hypothetical protein
MYIYEGGNIFGDGDIAKEYVAGVVKTVQRDMPAGIKAIPDIGSAGFKAASGDMDLFIDASALMQKFQVADDKAAKHLCKLKATRLKSVAAMCILKFLMLRQKDSAQCKLT